MGFDFGFALRDTFLYLRYLLIHFNINFSIVAKRCYMNYALNNIIMFEGRPLVQAGIDYIPHY